MQTPYGRNIDPAVINSLRDDIIAQYQYDRAGISNVPQPQQDNSIDWLNAAGLGALTAGAGALGYGAYRNRARIAEALGIGRRPSGGPPDSFSTGAGPKPPTPGSPPSAGPETTQRQVYADPWATTGAQTRQTVNRPQIYTDPVGRPGGVQVTDLNAPEVDYIERALGMFPEEQEILRRASEVGGVRRVDVSDAGVPTYVGAIVPGEASRQARQAGAIASVDDAVNQRLAEIQAQRQYQSQLRSTADDIINELRSNTGTQVTDLNLPAPQAQAANSGAQQDLNREILPGRKQQERIKAGAIFNQPSEQLEQSAQEFANDVLSAVQQTQAELERPISRKELRSRPGKGGAYEALIQSGIPEFEVKARVEAFANAVDPEEGIKFLNPEYNANTVGETAFADALGIVNARVNTEGQIVSGNLLNPQGDVRRSLRSAKKSVMQMAEGAYDPVAEELGALEGSISVTPGTGTVRGKGVSAAEDPEAYARSTADQLIKQQRLGEQYKKSIDEFGQTWDREVQNPNSAIKAPRRESRMIDSLDLDLPTRIEYGPDGERLRSVLYREQLPPEVVAKVESGEQVFIEDVPFMVNKERAIEMASMYGREMPELRATAQTYVQTGRELVKVYANTAGKFASSKTVLKDLGGLSTDYDPETRMFEQETKGGAFFEPGETGITPAYGRGSQKGKLVGGVPEPVLAEQVYRLSYDPPTEKGYMLTKAYGVDESGNVLTDGQSISASDLDLTRNSGIPLYLTNIKPSKLAINTQPMKLPRVLPKQQTKQVSDSALRTRREINDLLAKGLISPEEASGIQDFVNMETRTGSSSVGLVQGKYGPQKVYEAVDEIVQAPLEIQNVDGKVITYEGEIDRGQFLDFYAEAKRRVDDLGIKEKRYEAIANELQNIYGEKQGIRLPILNSPTSYDFITSQTGVIKSQPTIRRLVTQGDHGELYPISNEKLQEAQKSGSMPTVYSSTSKKDTSLPRSIVGPTNVLDLTESAKDLSGLPQEERIGWEAEDLEKTENYESSDLPVAFWGRVELGRSKSPQETKIAAGLTGSAPLRTVLESQAESDPQEFLKRFGSLDPQKTVQTQNVPNIYANEGRGNTLNLTDVNAVLQQQLIPTEVSKAIETTQPRIVRGDPMAELLRRDLPPSVVQAIQNPGGEYRGKVAKVGKQQAQERQELANVALQTPGGDLVLGKQVMPMGPQPGERGQIPAAIVQAGPAGLTASETMRRYGASPAQVEAVAESLMGDAVREINRQKQNRQALQNLATQQGELLESTPKARTITPVFRSTPEQQAQLRALQAGEARRRLFAEGAPSIGQLTLNI